jgi:hypothetical protein
MLVIAYVMKEKGQGYEISQEVDGVHTDAFGCYITDSDKMTAFNKTKVVCSALNKWATRECRKINQSPVADKE